MWKITSFVVAMSVASGCSVAVNAKNALLGKKNEGTSSSDSSYQMKANVSNEGAAQSLTSSSFQLKNATVGGTHLRNTATATQVQVQGQAPISN